MQGYLLKRYVTLGLESWKRRFFCLDSHGKFYYYSNSDSPLVPPTTATPVVRQHSTLSEAGADAAKVGGQPVSLLTANVRAGVEDASLANSFTVTSPETAFQLQAESAAERNDWVTTAQVLPRPARPGPARPSWAARLGCLLGGPSPPQRRRW